MITVFGADWCKDTQRTLRHLRRLDVAHRYVNVDDDLDALDYIKAATEGTRRTPVVLLREDMAPLVEPDDDTVMAAIVELEMLTREDVHQHLTSHRVLSVLAGLTAMALAAVLFRRWARA